MSTFFNVGVFSDIDKFIQKVIKRLKDKNKELRDTKKALSTLESKYLEEKERLTKRIKTVTDELEILNEARNTFDELKKKYIKK